MLGDEKNFTPTNQTLSHKSANLEAILMKTFKKSNCLQFFLKFILTIFLLAAVITLPDGSTMQDLTRHTQDFQFLSAPEIQILTHSSKKFSLHVLWANPIFLKSYNVCNFFGSNRSSGNPNVCLSVRASQTFLGSDLQAILTVHSQHYFSSLLALSQLSLSSQSILNLTEK